MYHLKHVPSETQIRKFVRRVLFGKNLFCPECRSRRVRRYKNRYHCKKCRIKFSLFSHTWLANTKVPLQKFWLILWCWTTQVPVRQTMALTKTSEKGTRHWYDLFRRNLPLDKEVLEHVVQLDEVYFGGWAGFALFIAKEKGTRKLAYSILPHNAPNRYEALEFLQSSVKPKSVLATDGAPIYQGIDSHYPVEHRFEIHDKFEFSQTAEIEGMIGVLKTFIRRMYHHVTPEKFPEIMGEFYYRFSHPEMFENPWYYLKNTLRLVPTG